MSAGGNGSPPNLTRWQQVILNGHLQQPFVNPPYAMARAQGFSVGNYRALYQSRLMFLSFED